MDATAEYRHPEATIPPGEDEIVIDSPRILFENIDEGLRIVEIWKQESKNGSCGRHLTVECRLTDAVGNDSWVHFGKEIGLVRGSDQERKILRLIDLLVHNNT